MGKTWERTFMITQISHLFKNQKWVLLVLFSSLLISCESTSKSLNKDKCSFIVTQLYKTSTSPSREIDISDKDIKEILKVIKNQSISEVGVVSPSEVHVFLKSETVIIIKKIEGRWSEDSDSE